MEPIRGSPLYIGHRAFGSLIKNIVMVILLSALVVYLHLHYASLLNFTIYTWHGIPFTAFYLFLFVIFIMILMLLIRHYQWTYIITTRQVYIKHGIIGSRVQNYLYNQVQEASSFQTVGQRLFLWGQLNITMLITLTGQSKVEEAHMDYIHRPKHIAGLMISQVSVGNV
jgi:membrane protein YdbS with pleckstrin-like domain